MGALALTVGPTRTTFTATNRARSIPSLKRPKAAARRRLPEGGCPKAAARRRLPEGGCPKAAVLSREHRRKEYPAPPRRPLPFRGLARSAPQLWSLEGSFPRAREEPAATLPVGPVQTLRDPPSERARPPPLRAPPMRSPQDPPRRVSSSTVKLLGSFGRSPLQPPRPLWMPPMGAPCGWLPRLHATHDTPPNRPPRRDREPNPLLGPPYDNAGTEPVYSFDAGSPHPNRTGSLHK